MSMRYSRRKTRLRNLLLIRLLKKKPLNEIYNLYTRGIFIITYNIIYAYMGLITLKK